MKLLIKLIDWAAGITELLLGLRFFFRLFSANPNALVTRWLFRISYPLYQPFDGIFTAQQLGNFFVIDYGILFTMVVYASAAYLLITLLLAFSRTLDRSKSKSTERPPYSSN